jgi:hypothetical protein
MFSENKMMLFMANDGTFRNNVLSFFLIPHSVNLCVFSVNLYVMFSFFLGIITPRFTGMKEKGEDGGEDWGEGEHCFVLNL